MRIAHKIISTLLALQLLVSFGLCGGQCCLARAKAPEQKAEPQKSNEAPTATSHCPMHARKAAAGSHQTPAPTARQEMKSSAALRKADCCIYRGSAPGTEPSQVSSSLQTHKPSTPPAPAPWRGSLIEPSPSPSPPKTEPPSSPQHAGYQLSLRI